MEAVRQIKCTVYRTANSENSLSDLTKFCTYFSKSFQLPPSRMLLPPSLRVISWIHYLWRNSRLLSVAASTWYL